MSMPTVDVVTDEIMAILDGISQSTDPAAARRASIRAIVERIRQMVLDGTVIVPATGLVVVDPVSGTLAVTGSAQGAVS